MMLDSISNCFRDLSVYVVSVLQWILVSNRHNFHEFPEVLNPLKTYMKNLYSGGRDELQPGRLDSLLTLENVTSFSSGKLPNLGQQVVDSVTKCFKDNLKQALHVSINVQVCLHHLEKFKVDFKKPEMIIHYKKLLHSVNFILQNGYGNTRTPVVILCLNQIKNFLPLLLLGIEKECPVVWRYAANCLKECLEKIQKEACEKTELPFSEFLNLMDSALNLFDDCVENTAEWVENSEEKMKMLKTVVDEVLCHAMSTAQVAGADREIILSRSQVILRGMETLRDDLAADNPSNIHLSADSVIDGLCSLERAVNAAVLRLVLYVSSGCSDPLRKLVAMCRPAEESAPASAIREKDIALESAINRSESTPVPAEIRKERDAEDLDDVIAEVDSYMDKLMQIGSFAVSCSANVKKAMELRSCLATFESLEAELVPSATSLYTESSISNKRTLRLFVDHWFKEIDKFRAVLDTIIDPTAYIEVVREFLSTKMRTIEGQEGAGKVESLEEITKACRTLKGVVEASVKQDCPNDSKQILQLSSTVSKAIESCERMKKKLELGVSLPSGIDEVVMIKILSLNSAVDELLNFLAEKVVQFQTSFDTDDSFADKSIRVPPPQKDYYKLCPLDLDVTSASLDKAMTPLINKAQLLAKGSVLYNTPKRSVVAKTPIFRTPAVVATAKKTRPSTVMRSRCFRSVAKKEDPKTDSSDMELTKLLDEISRLSSTFSLDETMKPPKDSDFKGRQLLDLFSSWDSLLETPSMFSKTARTDGSELPTPNFSSKNLDTPERLNDLVEVNDKIERLKMNLNDEAFF